MTIGQLMKILRDKGWIPRGDKEIIHSVYDKKHKMIGFYKEGKQYLELILKKSLRELVSKESGLWQFICENGMYDYKMGEHKNIVEDFFWNERENCNYYGYLWDKSCWEYYVVESALCNEDKLEQFLLTNIKINGK